MLQPVAPPVANAIEPAPLNGVLAMRGVVTDGIYRAAIGRVVVIDGTPIAREMGMRTSIVIFGTNERAFAQADLIANPDELQRVLKALRARDFTVTSIRKHTVGEHPESVFITVWKQGTALELARGLRFALDVEVGAAKVASLSEKE
jgi:acetolactate synthase regulatory subunit